MTKILSYFDNRIVNHNYRIWYEYEPVNERAKTIIHYYYYYYNTMVIVLQYKTIKDRDEVSKLHVGAEPSHMVRLCIYMIHMHGHMLNMHAHMLNMHAHMLNMHGHVILQCAYNTCMVLLLFCLCV